MTNAGEALLKELGTDQWACSGRSVEVRDFDRKCRVGLSFNRVFVELDGDEDQQETAAEFGINLLSTACSELNVEAIQIGIRQFFALDVNGAKEEQLVQKLLKIFGQPDFIGDNIDDVSYTFEVDPSADGRRGRVIVGAMTRDQWQQFVPYPDAGQNLGHLSTEKIERIKGSLPEDFVFVDVDFIKAVAKADETISDEEIKTFAVGEQAQNVNRIKRLLDQIKG